MTPTYTKDEFEVLQEALVQYMAGECPKKDYQIASDLLERFQLGSRSKVGVYEIHDDSSWHLVKAFEDAGEALDFAAHRQYDHKRLHRIMPVNKLDSSLFGEVLDLCQDGLKTGNYTHALRQIISKVLIARGE